MLYLFLVLMALGVGMWCFAWIVRGGFPMGLTVPLMSFVISSLCMPGLGYGIGLSSVPRWETALVFVVWAIGYMLSIVVPYCLAASEVVVLDASRIMNFRRREENRPTAVWFSGIGIVVAGMLIASLCSTSGEMPFTRALYEVTRLGYGHIYFGVTVFSAMALMSATWINSKYLSALFQGICLVLVAALGAKSAAMTLGLIIVLTHFLQVLDRPLRGFWILSLLLLVIVFVLVSFHGANGDGDVIANVAAYFDYTDNFLYLIDRGIDPRFGLYTFESEFLSLIPRVLFHDKPEVFGLIRLASDVLPYRRYDAGAASFGPFGVWYADYGNFGIFPMMIATALLSYASALGESRLRAHLIVAKGLPWFTPMVMYVSGLAMVSVGQGIFPGFLIAVIMSGIAWIMMGRKGDI